MERDVKLVFDFMMRLFKDVNLEDESFDIKLLPKADAIIKHMANHQSEPLPDVSRPVLKAIHKRLEDYVTAHVIHQTQPDYIPVPDPFWMSDEEMLRTVLTDFVTNQPLLGAKSD